MSETKHSGWVPRLRFPQFREAEGWKQKTLSGIAMVVMGSSPRSEGYNENQNGLPLLQGNADIKNRLSAPRVFASEITKECQIGDILMSVRAPVGSVAKSVHHACLGRGIAAIHSRRPNSQEFLYQWLLSYESRWVKISQGGTFEAINSDDLRQVGLTTPSPAEQHKIADCLSSVDELIAAQTRKVDALKAHKKGLMQQLFPREGETQPRLRFPEFKNAGEWARMSIQEMIDRQFIVGHLDGNHGELYPKAEEFSQNKEGIPYITANDFMNGSVDFSRCKRLPIERARLFKKGVAKDGDILFAHNATVGPVAKLNTSEDFVVLSTTATYFRCNSTHLSNDFLKSALSSPDFVAQYSRVMSQSTRNQVPITTQRKLDLHIPLLPEQQRLASCLSSLDTLITLETQKLEALKIHKKGLMQQLFPQVSEE